MIGIDLIRISRIDAAIKRGSFLRRAFSENERQHYKQKGGYAQTLAGIFAAKEALIKAAGLRLNGSTLAEIEILHLASGMPYVQFHGNTKKAIGDFTAHISISHDGDYAIAIALLSAKA